MGLEDAIKKFDKWWNALTPEKRRKHVRKIMLAGIEHEKRNTEGM